MTPSKDAALKPKRLRMSYQMEMVNQGLCPGCGEEGLCNNCGVCHGCDYSLTGPQWDILDACEQAAWEEEHSA